MMFSLAALGLAVAGMSGVMRLRTWGWLALAGTAGLLLGTGHLTSISPFDLASPRLATALLLAAVLPFAAPAFRFLRSRA